MSPAKRKFHYTTAKLLHWVVAFIAVLLLMSGWRAADLELEDKLLFMMIHSGLGFTLFALMIFRWWWRRNYKLYAPPKWHKKPSMLLQWFFYPLLLLQAVMGMLQAVFNDYDVRAFGLINFSAIAAENEVLFNIFNQIHTYTAILLIVLLFIHIIDKSRRFFVEDNEYLQNRT